MSHRARSSLTKNLLRNKLSAGRVDWHVVFAIVIVVACLLLEVLELFRVCFKGFIPHLALVACLGLAGCAGTNTTTSRYTFTDPSGRQGSIELPKDIQAEGVDIKTASGTTVKIKKLNSVGNTEQTTAQGKREAANLNQVSEIAGKVTEGAVQGAVKGVKGF